MAKTTKKKVTTRSPKMMLLEKIWLIAVENPVIECNLFGEDDEGRYGYVEAAAVFRMYGESFKNHKVHFYQVDKKTTVCQNCVLVEAEFEIADIETGYIWPKRIPGSGLGMNWQWSANTCQTLARKQALLDFFNCAYPQPEEFSKEVRRVTQNKFGAANSPEAIGDTVKEFFEQYPVPQKGKKK